jgi:hypothetical protein
MSITAGAVGSRDAAASFVPLLALTDRRARRTTLSDDTHRAHHHHGSPAEWLVQADFDLWQILVMPREQKITLGEMRSGSGPTRLIVYCSDFKCTHHVVVNADRWGDDVRLSDLEPRFTCKACGRRGADVRPLFERACMGA